MSGHRLVANHNGDPKCSCGYAPEAIDSFQAAILEIGQHIQGAAEPTTEEPMTLADDIAGIINESNVLPRLAGADDYDVKAIAEGLEREKIIIDRNQLPEVKEHLDGYFNCGEVGFFSRSLTAEKMRAKGLVYLAAAEHLESLEAKAEAVRRDEEAKLDAETLALAQADYSATRGYGDIWDETDQQTRNKHLNKATRLHAAGARIVAAELERGQA